MAEANSFSVGTAVPMRISLKNCRLSQETISQPKYCAKAILKEVYLNKKYLLDPHGAVGYAGLRKYLAEHKKLSGIFLETAHPVKFYDAVEIIIEEAVPIPPSINDLLKLKKVSVKMRGRYEELKSYLLSR